jgi:hypothetical protein
VREVHATLQLLREYDFFLGALGFYREQLVLEHNIQVASFKLGKQKSVVGIVSVSLTEGLKGTRLNKPVHN